MTDVLLSHSYYLRFDRKQLRTMQPYPPLSTLYAASALRDAGIRVALFDSMFASTEEELRLRIRELSPKIVVICDDYFNYLTKMYLERMRLASYRMLEIAQQAGCIVIVSALDSYDHASEYLQHGAKFVIYGEPEYTLRPIFRSVAANLNHKGIFLVNTVNRLCLAEIMIFMLKGKLSKAMRRIISRRARIGGRYVELYYHSKRTFISEANLAGFKLIDSFGLNIFAPPLWANDFFEFHKKFATFLEKIDNKARRIVLIRSLGDFMILVFQKVV